MRSRVLSAALAALSGVFLVATLWAQTASQIRGTVVDDDGKPLEKVKVEATGEDAKTRIAMTGKDGQFRFPLVRPSTYKVTFTLDSYSQVEKNVLVRLDATATVNAKLFRLTS